MILQDLYQIVQQGAQQPLFLWLDDYDKLSQSPISSLKKTSTKLHKNTRIAENTRQLISLLESSKPDEFLLAKYLVYISELLGKDVPAEHRELISDYIRDAKEFYRRAQMSGFHRQSRENLKKSLAPDEQAEHDLRLFQQEGMMYCLEYYLTIYKAIQDVTTEDEKRWYIESQEIDLGFGNVPGLWIDFSRDEVLDKFIYKILDKDIRRRLTEAYFYAKIGVMKVKMECDQTGNCQAVYSNITVNEVIKAFKKLVKTLLGTFQEVGIEQLSSVFFAPYGKKPFIKDIKI
ncbi:MAG: hypothetical protein HQ530_03460 [Parcubacteria group bacterium]|nr:hypothetical protein [Parcubacteria group bacterium]